MKNKKDIRTSTNLFFFFCYSFHIWIELTYYLSQYSLTAFIRKVFYYLWMSYVKITGFGQILTHFYSHPSSLPQYLQTSCTSHCKMNWIIRSYAHKISPIWPWKHELNKDNTNKCGKLNSETSRSPQSYLKSYREWNKTRSESVVLLKELNIYWLYQLVGPERVSLYWLNRWYWGIHMYIQVHICT